jgi:GTP-binding protein Era
MNENTSIPPGFRCGYAAIIGQPNVGKSTLMNCLLEQKISIVTRKPQTTRHKILGVLSTNKAQVIFLDTPGLIKPRYALHEAMMASAASAIADADVLLLMSDATRKGFEEDSEESRCLQTLGDARKPVFLVLNKVDLVSKLQLLPLIEDWARRFHFEEIYPVSALRADGTAELLQGITGKLPEHPPFYPTDIVSEQNERFFVAEIIREKVFLLCEEEIPYSTSVEIVEFVEREPVPGDGPAKKEKNPARLKWFIRADIHVERESQKGILIGKKGGKLKEIGVLARRDIEKFLVHPVYLDLHVKVREKWREDEAWLQRQGYKQ